MNSETEIENVFGKIENVFGFIFLIKCIVSIYIRFINQI
jgi:hypothetical protein